MDPTLSSFTRNLGSVEENWTRSTSGGTGIAVFGALLNRLIDGKHVISSVENLLDSHPLLRSQIVENAKSKLSMQVSDSYSASVSYVSERTWPSVSGEGHVGIVVFPKDHSDKQGSLALDKVINEEMNLNFLNADGKPAPPVRVFHVIFYPNNARSQTIIALKFHSGVLDRHSSSVIAREFLSTLSSTVEGTLSSSKDSKEGSILSPLEDFVPKGKASKGFLQKGIDAVGYAVNAKKYSLLPFQPSFSPSNKASFESNVVSLNLGKNATTSIFDACKEHGVIPAAALSAAFLRTVASLKELKEKKLDEFSYTCVIDCRSKLEPKIGESVLGNYSLGIPQNEKVKDGIAFWEFARNINSSIEKDIAKSKQFSEMSVLSMLFSQVMKHPSLTPSSSMRTTLFTLFVDPPMEAQWKGVENLDLVGTVGPFSSMHFVGPCFCLGETVYEGPEFVLSFIYPSPLYSREQILDVLKHSADLLAAESAIKN